jgi:hypothetical protein
VAELDGKQEGAINTSSLLNMHIFIDFNHYFNNYLMEFSISKEGAMALFALHVASDENGRKNSISTSVSIFFGGNRIRFGKYGFETESGYADVRKRTNTDGEPKN